jgi:hypothetical protein
MNSKELPVLRLAQESIEDRRDQLVPSGRRLFFGDPAREHVDHERGCEHVIVQNDAGDDCRLETVEGMVVYHVA